MAKPQPYQRSYSFTNYQADVPDEPLPGVRVDAELDDIANASKELTDLVNAGFEVDINMEDVSAVANEIDKVVFVADNMDDVRVVADLGPNIELATELFLGAFASDPTMGNDGDPLTLGATYYNTTIGESRVWNGSSWVPVAKVSVGGVLQGTIVVPADTTTFTIGDYVSLSLAQNGLTLRPGIDYTMDSPNFTVPGVVPGDILTYFGILKGSEIDAASFVRQTFLTTAGVTTYAVNSAGAPLALTQTNHILFGGSPYGPLTYGVDYTIVDGAVVLAYAPEADELYTVFSMPRFTNSEAQVILQNYKDEVAEEADRAEEAADRAEAASLVYKPDVAGVLALSGTFAPGTKITTQAEGFSYEVVASGQDLTSSGGIPLRILDRGISPGHFGATPGIATDEATRVQQAFTAAMASWNAAKWAFDRDVDFRFQTYRSDASINSGGIRQPRLRVKNGQIHSRAAGKIALDCALSNGVIFEDFLVYGDASAPPRWGIYTGRALLNGAYPGVDGVTFLGVSGAWGYFNRGAYLGFAAEVQKWSDRTVFENRSRSLSAVSAASIDNAAILVTQFGSAETSDFYTLPDVASGSHSNICHDWGQVNMRRVADYNLTITAISKAAQAVITVTAGTLAAANIAVGNRIHISGGDMTEMAYKTFEVTAVGTNTVTVNVDSTSFTTYTGGATMQNQTGPALLVGGARTVSAQGAYFLTYGAPNIIIDADGGGAPYDWNLQYQSERHANDQITIRKASGTVVIPQFHISTTQTSQNAARSIIRINGGGSVRFDVGSLRISNMGEAPSDSVLSPQASFNCRAFDIDVPLSAALPNPDLMGGYSGFMVAQDRNPAMSMHGADIRFVTSATALTAPGLRWSGASLFTYMPDAGAERQVMVTDTASLAELNNIGSRFNTTGKYAGRPVWVPGNSRHASATGGGAGAVWTWEDGTTAATPA